MADSEIYIGLGGAGVQTAAHLKAKMLQACDGDRRKLDAHCRFIFIDTANRLFDRMNDAYQWLTGIEPLIARHECVNLGGVNPHAEYTVAQAEAAAGRAKAKQKRLLSFVDANAARLFNNAPLADGASGNRQQGRVAVWSQVGRIQDRISAALDELTSINQDQAVQNRPLPVTLISGSCGGTGSSAFLDVAYILDREIKRRHPDWGAAKNRAVLFMPNWYIEHYRSLGSKPLTIENYQANGYAFMQEVGHFLAAGYPVRGDGGKGHFSAVAVDPDIDRPLASYNRDWPVFNFIIAVDSTTELGAAMTDEDMYKNTAEMLYYWHEGHTQGTMVEAFDNLLKSSYQSRGADQPVPATVTMGYRALNFPEALMRDYFEARFAADLFKYGLIGETYEAALSDEKKRREEIESVFKEGISRYLFEADRADGVPNLEDHLRQNVVERGVRSLSPGRFRKEGQSFTDRITFRRQEYDPERVANHAELQRLKQTAEGIIADIRAEMEAAFTASAGPVSRERLLNLMRFGCETQEGVARTGGLERWIENVVLRFGLTAGVDFANKLDIAAAVRVTELKEAKSETEARLGELEAEINSALRQCLEAKKRDRPNHFTALFTRLQEKIRRSADLTILTQQIRVLNDLCEGDAGVLDLYRKNLEAMLSEVQAAYNGQREGEGTPNLLTAYETNLSKRFVATAEDVTTSYLPDVKAFVGEETTWVHDHDFERLYGTMVKLTATPQGKRPLRHGDDFGRHPERQGLHRCLTEMLTGEATTGRPKGYEVDGEVCFFRSFFTLEKADPLRAMAARVKDVADAYIRQLMRGSRKVGEEVNKPLYERFRALPHAQQKLLKERFTDEGTQTFCKMSLLGGNTPTSYYLYVGSDERLARALGLQDSSKHQFLSIEGQNRFLKIKAHTLFALEQYPHYESYERIYHAIREERRGQAIFAPHIHRLFNEHGVAEGMRMLTERIPDEALDLFVRMLLYCELFKLAKDGNAALLKEIFYLQPRMKGDRETLHLPMEIKSPEGASHPIVLACGEVGERDGKLLLERGKFRNVGVVVRTYMDVFNGINGEPEVVAALRQVDKFFRRHCSTAWLKYYEEAVKKLEARLKPHESFPDELTAFYTDLANRLVDLEEPLRNLIASKPVKGKRQVKDEKAETASSDYVIPID